MKRTKQLLQLIVIMIVIAFIICSCSQKGYAYRASQKAGRGCPMTYRIGD